MPSPWSSCTASPALTRGCSGAGGAQPHRGAPGIPGVLLRAGLAVGPCGSPSVPKSRAPSCQRCVPEHYHTVPAIRPLRIFNRCVPTEPEPCHRALCHRALCPQPVSLHCPASPQARAPEPGRDRAPTPAVPGAGTHRGGKAEPLHFGWSEGRESKVCLALTLQQQEIVRRRLAVSAPAGANGSPGRG